MNYRCSVIPMGHVSHIWPKVGPMLERAFKRTNGRHNQDDVLRDVLTGRYQLWVAFKTENDQLQIDGAVVTQVIEYPWKKMLAAIFCAGTHLSEWKNDMMGLLDKFGVDQGCDGFEFTGRKGWKKALAENGLKEVQTVFEKDYDDGR